MVKVVSLFLIAMLVLAMFGRLRLPKLPSIKRSARVQSADKCKKCGSYTLADKTCQCGG